MNHLKCLSESLPGLLSPENEHDGKWPYRREWWEKDWRLKDRFSPLRPLVRTFLDTLSVAPLVSNGLALLFIVSVSSHCGCWLSGSGICDQSFGRKT